MNVSAYFIVSLTELCLEQKVKMHSEYFVCVRFVCGKWITNDESMSHGIISRDIWQKRGHTENVQVNLHARQ